MAATVTIGSTTCTLDRPEQDAMLEVPDVEGSYALPFIQASPCLDVAIRGTEEPAALGLAARAGTAARQAARPASAGGVCRLGPLTPGEHRLEIALGNGPAARRFALNRIGIGAVIAALGDSITEGYFGRGFRREAVRLTSALFPRASVSADGRNFPQFAPTAARYKPEVNCFESWMTRLNDGLATALGQPVFIANEGWGGYKTSDYLALMRTDPGWRARQARLRPALWLIHLGVNDGRARRPAGDVEADLDAIVSELVATWGASPGRILVARPCFDYWPGADAILREYGALIDALVARRGLRAGPDFFAAYATDRARWYGTDPVHPNEAGMDYMADLWRDAIVAAIG